MNNTRISLGDFFGVTYPSVEKAHELLGYGSYYGHKPATNFSFTGMSSPKKTSVSSKYPKEKSPRKEKKEKEMVIAKEKVSGCSEIMPLYKEELFPESYVTLAIILAKIRKEIHQVRSVVYCNQMPKSFKKSLLQVLKTSSLDIKQKQKIKRLIQFEEVNDEEAIRSKFVAAILKANTKNLSSLTFSSVQKEEYLKKLHLLEKKFQKMQESMRVRSNSKTASSRQITSVASTSSQPLTYHRSSSKKQREKDASRVSKKSFQNAVLEDWKGVSSDCQEYVGYVVKDFFETIFLPSMKEAEQYPDRSEAIIMELEVYLHFLDDEIDNDNFLLIEEMWNRLGFNS